MGPVSSRSVRGLCCFYRNSIRFIQSSRRVAVSVGQVVAIEKWRVGQVAWPGVLRDLFSDVQSAGVGRVRGWLCHLDVSEDWGGTYFRQVFIAAGTVIAVYGTLWLWSGYNPVKALLVGIANQARQQPTTGRVWPRTVPFDLADLRWGLVGFTLLALFYLVGIVRKRSRFGSLVL